MMCIPGGITGVRNRESISVVTVIPEPASTSPGNLLEMQILGDPPRNPEDWVQ